MLSSNIKAELRGGTETGRRLRRDGYVPAVVYGHKDETKNVKIGTGEISNLIAHHGTKAKLEISLDDKTIPVFIKEYQRDPITNGYISFGFQILYQDEILRIDVPVSFHNAAQVIDYILHEDMTSIEIEAFPSNLPERIDADVEGIRPEKPLRIKDLAISKDKNVKIIADPETIVASAHHKKEMQLEAEIDKKEPELIGETEAETE